MGEGWVGEGTVFGRARARSMGGEDLKSFRDPLPRFEFLGLTYAANQSISENRLTKTPNSAQNVSNCDTFYPFSP
jgi:hypothetical protein